MFDEKENCCIRKEKIYISAFALETMQIVVEVGHFNVKESHIVKINAIDENSYLVFYLCAGDAILVDKDYFSLEAKTTLIKQMNKDYSLYLNECECYYALLKGNRIDEFLKGEQFILDMGFSKKSEIFFYSLFSSLDKYKRCDEYSIAASVLRLYSDKENYLSGFKDISKKQEIVEKALSFIEKNYQKDIGLVDISNASGYSEYYFLRIFKEVMRMTPYEYLIRKRLSQVKILLLTSDKTIEEIAYACGFKSDISLYKAFKNAYSITPREFKKM